MYLKGLVFLIASASFLMVIESSCTVTKRQYNRGYYIDFHTTKRGDNKGINHQSELREPDLELASAEPSSQVENNTEQYNQIDLTSDIGTNIIIPEQQSQRHEKTNVLNSSFSLLDEPQTISLKTELLKKKGKKATKIEKRFFFRLALSALLSGLLFVVLGLIFTASTSGTGCLGATFGAVSYVIASICLGISLIAFIIGIILALVQ